MESELGHRHSTGAGSKAERPRKPAQRSWVRTPGHTLSVVFLAWQTVLSQSTHAANSHSETAWIVLPGRVAAVRCSPPLPSVSVLCQCPRGFRVQCSPHVCIVPLPPLREVTALSEHDDPALPSSFGPPFFRGSECEVTRARARCV